MIDIEINSSIINQEEIDKLEELKEIKGIVIHCVPDFFTYTEKSAFTESAILLAHNNKLCSGKGYHFIIDSTSIVKCVPENKQTEHVSTSGKATFISRAMYDGKPNESSIGILMTIPEDEKYEDIERKTIKFIADYLIQKKLTPDSVMRGFDLNETPTPLHLLEKEKWRNFIKLLEDVYKAMKGPEEETEEEDKKEESRAKDEYDDEMLEKASTTYTDKDIREFYLKNGQSAEEYAKKYEPDHRDIEAIVNFKSSDVGEIKEFTTNQNTTFTYSVVENVPASSDHCSRAFDTLAGKAIPNQLEVEPIYPDLAVPPGGTITLLNSLTEDKPVQDNKVPLSIEEFENREQAFNIKNYKDAKKTVEGKPVNNNDPFPTDDKIKELESHSPKVKIDEVGFKLHDCNHPQSVIGPEVAKNFAMVQDEIITMAKRTERRLVKLENILSTVMRNVFRTASRMQVNCVYYGGQDVYGKYKCIRCLHNDRVSDGQSMTLDQCLSCTRYEPILGQVYAILDETGTNVAQVLDDIQMSYMSMDEYIRLTRTEELHVERGLADVSHEATQPKAFSEIFEEGFKMDWNPTLLETQRPNIAEYKAEGIEAVKHEVVSENEPTIEDEFKDTIEENEAYEELKYNSDDYTFDNFGESDGLVTLDITSLGGGSATEIRSKIVAYAENALKLCQEGKAGYSQLHRQKHLENALNGISYWDCSSLAEAAYKAAGLTSIAGNTKTEFPKCMSSAGGIFIPIQEVDKAIPGDLVWFSTLNPTVNSAAEAEQISVGTIQHVAIYVGNGEYIHASSDSYPLTQQIKRTKISKQYDPRIFAFGRPKDLIEADNKAAELAANGEGFFDYDSHGYNNDITTRANKYCASQVESTIKYMNQYGYKQAVIDISKKHNLDPYLVLGLIATESAGNPLDRSGSYWGLMQTHSSVTRATGNLEDIKKDIETGCAHYHQIRNYMKKPRGENPVLALHAYNAGNGTVDKACNNYGQGAENVKGGQIAQYVADVAVAAWGQSKQNECTAYVACIILRANAFRAKKVLG